jgi:hypothetical protein
MGQIYLEQQILDTGLTIDDVATILCKYYNKIIKITQFTATEIGAKVGFLSRVIRIDNIDYANVERPKSLIIKVLVKEFGKENDAFMANVCHHCKFLINFVSTF